ncbi:hypothetical protein BBJ29_008921 [Phytophthora kernoviae]|uniref:Uncharacterized protein n=1 Tax=Phytophthora kernoviae TaxID=325452 RepID=A0A3F2RMG1_9STRA|nr:hypothetical protein BBJ29_008921 [Phytophthora kernoviae]RLN60504.1 hypothetical protein BBP00_00005941 [Phytophthora kernoviae]
MDSDVAPLLLAGREVVRGSTSTLPQDAEIIASAMSSTHLSVLFRSQTDQNCVRLGVFHTAERGNVEEPELLDLLPEPSASKASQDPEDHWTLVWSPDGRLLVVSGRIPGAEGAFEGVMWLFARPEWLNPATATTEPTLPLLLRVDPKNYLSAKQWTPMTAIVSVFFPSRSGSKLFILSADGLWLSVSVQLAKLQLVAMDRSASEDTAGLFTMKVMKKLTEWHAGVTAASYEQESATLVVSGGLQDPSDDLVKKQASSLSVWKVLEQKDSKDVAELLDYTMVLKGRKQVLVSEIDASAGTSTTDLYDPDSSAETSNGGLLTSMKSSLFAPLKMMVGGETKEAQVMPGSIRHLALAPNGNFMSMLDGLGRLAIRQIDTCADVLKWKTVEDVVVDASAHTQDCAIKHTTWLTSDILALILTNNSVVYSKFNEEGGASGPTNSDSENEILSPLGASSRLMVISVKHHRPAMGSSGASIHTLALTSSGHPSGDEGGISFTACEVITTGSLWVANLVHSLTLNAQMENSGQLFTLNTPGDFGDDTDYENSSVVAVVLLPENRIQDLTDEELAEFENYSRLSCEERGTAYGEWFTKRILDMDTRYGQLASAYELSRLATKCLSGWSTQETKLPFEEFFLHTERLYKCVYQLELPACCLLPLNEWSSLSMQEQAMMVAGIDQKEAMRDITAIINRLQLVFVAQRRDRTYALDDLFVWLAKTILSKPSLMNLSLSAQLLYQSNPSLTLKKRWIQSDVRLIETALGVVYAVDVTEVLGVKAPSEDEDAYMQRHLALVEQLWTIFQSLPIRKENDPPEVAQLQVAVDEMEDLMVTMDCWH